MEIVFELFKNMPTKNVISWTTMIFGYVRVGMYKEALNLFQEMQIEGALNQGRWIHAYIDKTGTVIGPILGCAFIDMFAKCVSLWSALIYGFAIHGRGREVLDWFENMQKVGIKSYHVTFTAILVVTRDWLMRENHLFEGIGGVHKLRPRIEHYGCVVDLLGRTGLLEEANMAQSLPDT
ncbi:hypothetical protein GQ457_02G007210 [Hibiscus cannabinus]